MNGYDLSTQQQALQGLMGAGAHSGGMNRPPEMVQNAPLLLSKPTHVTMN